MSAGWIWTLGRLFLTYGLRYAGNQHYETEGSQRVLLGTVDPLGSLEKPKSSSQDNVSKWEKM